MNEQEINKDKSRQDPSLLVGIKEKRISKKRKKYFNVNTVKN